MIMKDGKNYYWCDQHKYPLSATQGIYVFHKPTEHDAWLARKTALNERHGKGSRAEQTIPASVSTPKPSVTPRAAKLLGAVLIKNYASLEKNEKKFLVFFL